MKELIYSEALYRYIELINPVFSPKPSKTNP